MVSKNREKLLIVLKKLSKYTYRSKGGVSVQNFHAYLKLFDIDVSERTLRRIMDDLDHMGFVQKREDVTPALYIVDRSLLPQAEHSDMYESEEDFTGRLPG